MSDNPAPGAERELADGEAHYYLLHADNGSWAVYEKKREGVGLSHSCLVAGIDSEGWAKEALRIAEELHQARAEVKEQRALFDRMWAADMRGIKLWQAESPEERELKWPGRQELVQWLLERLAEAREDAEGLGQTSEAIRQRGPLVIWENESGFAFAWGRIPREGEIGDGGDYETLTEVLDAVRAEGGEIVDPATRSVYVPVKRKCFRKQTDMTPCVVEDGEDARSDDGYCVGCGLHVSAKEERGDDTTTG